MNKYRIEMRVGQDQRMVEADQFQEQDNWMIFYRKPPQGGPALEYWRVRVEDVVCMETCR